MAEYIEPTDKRYLDYDGLKLVWGKIGTKFATKATALGSFTGEAASNKYSVTSSYVSGDTPASSFDIPVVDQSTNNKAGLVTKAMADKWDKVDKKADKTAALGSFSMPSQSESAVTINATHIAGATTSSAVIPAATTSLAGVMTSTDKTNLDNAVQTVSGDSLLITASKSGTGVTVSATTKLSTAITDLGLKGDDGKSNGQTNTAFGRIKKLENGKSDKSSTISTFIGTATETTYNITSTKADGDSGSSIRIPLVVTSRNESGGTAGLMSPVDKETLTNLSGAALTSVTVGDGLEGNGKSGSPVKIKIDTTSDSKGNVTFTTSGDGLSASVDLSDKPNYSEVMVGIAVGDKTQTDVKINKILGNAKDDQGPIRDGLTLPAAVASKDNAGGTAGLMTANDKEKLDGMKNMNHAATSAELTGVVTGTSTLGSNKLTIKTTIGKGVVTENELNDSVNASLDKADAALPTQTYKNFIGSETSLANALSKVKVTAEAGNDKLVTASADDTGRIITVGTTATLQTAVTDLGLIGDTKEKNTAFGKIAKNAADIDSINKAIAGGTHFKGVLKAKPTDTKGYVDGDIIVISGGETVNEGLEFICSGGIWYELGNSTAEGARITALENGTKAAGKASKIATTKAIGGTQTPVYVAANGTVTAGTALEEAAYMTKESIITGLAKTVDIKGTLTAAGNSKSNDFVKSASLANGKLTGQYGSFADITAGKASKIATSKAIGANDNPVFIAADGTVTASSYKIAGSSEYGVISEGLDKTTELATIDHAATYGQEAKTYAEDLTVNGKALVNKKATRTPCVLNGADLKVTGYTTSGISGNVAADDTINTAIAKVEVKANAAATAGVTKLTGDTYVTVSANTGAVKLTTQKTDVSCIGADTDVLATAKAVNATIETLHATTPTLIDDTTPITYVVTDVAQSNGKITKSHTRFSALTEADIDAICK